MKIKLVSLSVFLFLVLVFGSTPTALAGLPLATPASNSTVSPKAAAASASYIIPDAPNDAAFPQQEIKFVNVTVNTSSLVIRVSGDVFTGGDLVFIDTNPGTGIGYSDLSTGAHWIRPVKLPSNFGAEYWAAGWEQGYGDLYDSSGATIATSTTPLAGYGWKYDGTSQIKTYRFDWSLLYATVPSSATIGLLVLTSGGDGSNVYDSVPSQAGVPAATTSEFMTLKTYLNISVTSISSPALAPTPQIGYLSHETDNLAGGNLTAGNPLIMSFNTWFHSPGNSSQPTVNDNANSSALVQFDYKVERTGVNTSYKTYAYKEFGSRVGLGSDKQVVKIDATQFQDGDHVFWWAKGLNNATDISVGTVSGSFYVAPLPPFNVTYLGGISPTGGFVAPNKTVTIQAQNNLKFADGTSINADPAANVPVRTTIYWRGNNTGTFMSKNMSWLSYKNLNNNYEVSIGPYYTGNITYYVTTYGFNKTGQKTSMITQGNFTLLVGIEPPRNLQYNISDPKGDLSLRIPKNNPPFAPGVIDILNFEVLSNQYNTEFRVTFANLTNGFSSSLGFSVVIFSVYVDNGPGGATSTLWNEAVQTSTQWNYALKSDGFVNQYFKSSDLSAPFAGSGIQASGNTTTNVASIVIPTKMLGGQPNNTWKYYLFSGSDDFNKFRSAGAKWGADWQLGGGVDGPIDPNVVDMLVPVGSPATLQNDTLSRYDLANSKVASVLPVGSGEKFIKDTTAPKFLSFNVTNAGKLVTNGASFEVATSTSTVDFRVDALLHDDAQGSLSGLAKVELFDGNLLLGTQKVVGYHVFVNFNISLGVGTHDLKANLFDASGNFVSQTFKVVITAKATPTSTPTSATSSSSGGGFIPVDIVPVLGAFVVIGLVITLKKKKFV